MERNTLPQGGNKSTHVCLGPTLTNHGWVELQYRGRKSAARVAGSCCLTGKGPEDENRKLETGGHGKQAAKD